MSQLVVRELSPMVVQLTKILELVRLPSPVLQHRARQCQMALPVEHAGQVIPREAALVEEEQESASAA